MAGEHGNKAMGKTKQVAGSVLGDAALRKEGQIQEGTGKAQDVVKDASRKVEDALGKMGTKLAAKRRERASGRPERSRRDLDRDY
jgi:uncharacterized protein YjbJ (UPF0337 family)